MLNALQIHVQGIVQGVGFRPFVYRLAKRYVLGGWVLNAVDGVHIHVEGEEQLVDEFVLEMHNNPPAAAHIARIDMKEVPLEGFDSFEIRFSEAAEVEETTLVSPDLATCSDCLEELFNESDRRYHYPFINCTNCGPRFTIIDGLPYDRANTSMQSFEMCADCAEEYTNPANRRFHAQPDACFECGPALCLVDLSVQTVAAGASCSSQFIWARTREESDAIIEQAVAALREGKIVAVKGLGGFHLVCDAANETALAELRARKRREGKAFAVMLESVDAVREYCEVGVEEAALLESPARPIVLLRKRSGVVLAKGLADGLPELGVMLPATPLQHLLMRAFGGMLVFTSGNVHNEPIQTDDQQACSALAGIAHLLVGNNRPIRSRYDDSVVRVLNFGGGETAVQFIRRARGYAPLPISIRRAEGAGNISEEGASSEIPASPLCIFATGPEQKNTFCFLQDGKAFVSQHIGDMENAPTFDSWLETKQTYQRLFDLAPTHIACDMHPEYLSSKWAAQQSLPVVQVQHHHAHIVSAMVEHGLEGPVLGFAFDGTGAGPDGAIWGGEVLLANTQTYERFANFSYFPLPGGAAAIQHPLRAAYGALWAFDLLEHPAAEPVLQALGDQAQICQQQIDKSINCPQTSSAGRLFDAASAILGLCTHATYEGQPAILLEAAMYSGVRDVSLEGFETPFLKNREAISFKSSEDPERTSAQARAAKGPSKEIPLAPSYSIDMVKNTATEESTALDTSVVLLDAAPLFASMLDDLAAGVPASAIAQKFHDAFVAAIVQVAQLAQAAYEINTVVLSGGVFMNRYLCEHAVPVLAQAGFTVAMNKDLPPNDGCISLGQAVVAAHAKS